MVVRGLGMDDILGGNVIGNGGDDAAQLGIDKVHAQDEFFFSQVAVLVLVGNLPANTRNVNTGCSERGDSSAKENKGYRRNERR